jgi:hypothetical protein
LCAAKSISTGLGVFSSQARFPLYSQLLAAWCMGHRKEQDRALTQQRDCVKYPGRASSVGSVAAEQEARKAKRPCSSGGSRTPKRLCMQAAPAHCSWMLSGMGAEKTGHVPPHACSKRRQARVAGLHGHGHERTEAGGAGPVGQAVEENKSAPHHSPAIGADSPNFPSARSAWEDIWAATTRQTPTTSEKKLFFQTVRSMAEARLLERGVPSKVR